MPFSHHSHSGEFCGHAADSLEAVVQDAIAKGMTTFCLTEHIHRERIDFYPNEELDHTPETLEQLYDDFYHEARRLQQAYVRQIRLFVGFEGEWIRPASLTIIEDLLKKYEFDLFVGSVHHVHAIAIDYDTNLYHQARDAAGGTEEKIFHDYFDDQLAMFQALKPPVVGHFDLIRLFSDDSNRSFRTWNTVWDKIMRNLRFVASYGGVLEVNSSSLRKGMTEAYPQVEICEEFRALGGRFTLSDDSHGIQHVGLNYGRALECVKKAGITELVYLASISENVKAHDERFPKVGWKTAPIHELEAHKFWKSSTS